MKRRGPCRGMAVSTALLIVACVMGCQDLPSVVSGPEGRVLLALVLPGGGATISNVSWTVKSPSNQVVASGSIDTSRSGASASFALGLANSKGYVVTMAAKTSGGDTCSGSSAPFDVVAGQTTPVSISLICPFVTPDAGLGSILVTGTVVPGDNCPALAFWSTSPETAAANGGQIDVTGTATDADPGDTLTYSWSAAAGSFAAPASATTTYTCGPAGSQVLHLTVSDNHVPTPCWIDVAFPPVSCN